THRARPHSRSARPQHRALDRAAPRRQHCHPANTQRHPRRSRWHTAPGRQSRHRRKHLHPSTKRAKGTTMNAPTAPPKTLFEKVWQQHLVAEPAGEPSLLYIDLHLIHEVTSPQAFDGLRMAGRKLRRPDRMIAPVDHNVPTTSAYDRL